MTGRIFVTGDVHRNLDIEKLWWKNFRTQEQLDRDDYMIILGDFGAVWDKYTDGKILSWWESRPYTTLFIDGNHENFDLLDKYPIEEKLGGKVGIIKPHVWHLLRGESYHIAGRDFWCFGGARSIDLANRRMGKTWWPQEMPSDEDYQNGLIGLEKINYKPDYILTHDAPITVIPELEKLSGFSLTSYDEEEQILREYLADIQENSAYAGWYFGHYHMDHRIDKHMYVMYNEIKELR